GMKSDHRIPMRPTDISRLVLAIASKLGVAGVSAEVWQDPWFDPLVRDLQAHSGTSIVVAGQSQPPYVHALIHAGNAKLGNIDQTINYQEPVEIEPVLQTDSLRQLVRDMSSGQVEMLAMWGVNPVYDAPAELNFSNSLTNVRQRISHSLIYDETAAE